MLYDNDYDSADEYDEYSELSQEIMEEIEYYNKLDIISFYKDKLYYEVEFSGIKNISLSEIYYIIQTTHIAHKLYPKDHRLNSDQLIIFDNMYKELYDKISDISIYNTVTKKIFDKIYIN